MMHIEFYYRNKIKHCSDPFNTPLYRIQQWVRATDKTHQSRTIIKIKYIISFSSIFLKWIVSDTRFIDNKRQSLNLCIVLLACICVGYDPINGTLIRSSFTEHKLTFNSSTLQCLMAINEALTTPIRDGGTALKVRLIEENNLHKLHHYIMVASHERHSVSIYR